MITPAPGIQAMNEDKAEEENRFRIFSYIESGGVVHTLPCATQSERRPPVRKETHTPPDPILIF
jgi:hypothetical protein